MKKVNKKKLLISLLLVVCIITCNFVVLGTYSKVNATTSPFDNNDIVYMVLTDRFYDGDYSNNGTLGNEYRPGELKYTQGGD
ncbi:hypothetical protein SAMN05443428_10897 [Caloramator quimbayensis]|uniref:Uncharacterized protein n=1 Tax=Caloramator quimbayensis TaxID=1147123 RepID=A0A1T4XEL0_9CLOT|nr:hypothetical protein [Caloramator quimbayensis]SKA87996.1 hypothetical protein SAMN05443428_10897 [Caloramator quimbayensis]